jgi:hypothetical protein
VFGWTTLVERAGCGRSFGRKEHSYRPRVRQQLKHLMTPIDHQLEAGVQTGRLDKDVGQQKVVGGGDGQRNECCGRKKVKAAEEGQHTEQFGQVY